MLSRVKFTHWLFIAFWVYVLICLSAGLFHHIPNAIISTPFIVGICSILVVTAIAFVHRKIYEIALLLFLVTATFYLQFDPYTVTVVTFTFNSVTLFAGRVIPLIFLITYLYHFRKPVIHFIRTTKLWND